MLKRLSDVLPRPDPWKSCIERSELTEELERAVVKEMHRIVGRAETERDIAKELKLFLEREVGGRWCGIVGTAFGTFLTYEEQGFIHLRHEDEHIILFKSA
nr:unnamed protein product [Spirometra erinaceieuropaei]